MRPRRILRTTRKNVSRLLVQLWGYHHPALTRFQLRLSGSEPSFGLSGLDRKILHHLGGRRSGYFVELGANNGVSQSNTLLLETFWGWRGTLIEPVEESFLQLRRNRSAKRNHLVRAACVSFDFAHSTVQIAASGLMSAPIGVDSDIRDPIEHAKAGLKHTPGRDKITVEEVPARTLTDVLDDVAAPLHIDLLSLDVEGGEIEVLNGLNFQRYSFTTLVVESRSIQRLEKLLNSKGYHFATKLSAKDYLFVPSE